MILSAHNSRLASWMVLAWLATSMGACAGPEGKGDATGEDPAAPIATVPEPAALPGVEPNEEAVAAARSILGDSVREADCGPYELITDVTDPRLLDACTRIGAQLDITHTARLGLAPIGEPRAAILLFADGEDFRTFSRTEGRVAVGYAGFARPVRGYLAMWTGEPPYDDFPTTLAHELAHLVQRRSLGPSLPPWLAEGLADAIGDPANFEGLGTLSGLQGVEAQVARLRQGYRDEQVGSVQRLLQRHRGDFDAEQPSYDYEQSALLVRFLLLDEQLGPRFKTFLGRLAAGQEYAPAMLVETLDLTWQELDARLRAWVEAE